MSRVDHEPHRYSSCSESEISTRRSPNRQLQCLVVFRKRQFHLFCHATLPRRPRHAVKLDRAARSPPRRESAVLSDRMHLWDADSRGTLCRPMYEQVKSMWTSAERVHGRDPTQWLASVV